MKINGTTEAITVTTHTKDEDTLLVEFSNDTDFLVISAKEDDTLTEVFHVTYGEFLDLVDRMLELWGDPRKAEGRES